MPCTPIALRASRTSSSLKGFTTAVTIFMVGISRLAGASNAPLVEQRRPGSPQVHEKREGASERVLDAGDHAGAPRELAVGRLVVLLVRIGADDFQRGREAL